jgi:ABC-type multidrug transport system fused ATPase/permease subunit
MTLGSLTAIMIYLTQLVSLIMSIGGLYETITINSVSRQRLAEILDLKPEIQDKENAMDYRIPQGKIDFRDVYFGYKKDEFILKNISFSIEPASKIAMVGKSGCGKTTLLGLILRLYDIEKGVILIDGRDIKDIKLKSLKEQIGMVPQEPFLWNDTVANNILYGKEDVEENEMIKAAQISEAHNFILSLPKQYNSIIGEMACKLSEGQKQRIAIARAVIKRPKILILDEAMSSLDSETEDKIIENIKREFRDSTIIIVSHRLSAVKKMDLVYFLKNSEEIVRGKLSQLIEKEEAFYNLFTAQIEEKAIFVRDTH